MFDFEFTSFIQILTCIIQSNHMHHHSNTNQRETQNRDILPQRTQRSFDASLKRESILLSSWYRVKVTVLESPHREMMLVVRPQGQTRIQEIINLTHSRLSNNLTRLDERPCFGLLVPSQKKYYLAGRNTQDTLTLLNYLSRAKKGGKTEPRSNISKNTVDEYPKDVVESARHPPTSFSAHQISGLEEQNSSNRSSMDKSEALHYNPTTATRLAADPDIEDSFYTAIEENYEYELEQEQEEKQQKQKQKLRQKEEKIEIIKQKKQMKQEEPPRSPFYSRARIFHETTKRFEEEKPVIMQKEETSDPPQALRVQQPLSIEQIQCIDSDEGFKLSYNFSGGRLLTKAQKSIKASIICPSTLTPQSILQSFFRFQLWNQKIKDYKVVNRIDKGIYLVKLQLHRRNFFSLPRYCFMLAHTCIVMGNCVLVLRSLDQAHFQKQFGYSWIRMDIWAKADNSRNGQRVLTVCGRFEDKKDYQEGLLFFDEVKDYQVFLQTSGNLSQPILEWQDSK